MVSSVGEEGAVRVAWSSVTGRNREVVSGSVRVAEYMEAVLRRVFALLFHNKSPMSSRFDLGVLSVLFQHIGTNAAVGQDEVDLGEVRRLFHSALAEL